MGLSESVNQLKIMVIAKRKKDNGTNNDLQNTTQNTNDRVTRIPLRSGGETRCPRKGRKCLLNYSLNLSFRLERGIVV